MKLRESDWQSGYKTGAWSLAVYFLLVLLRWFFGNADFSLSDFSEFYISQATVDGISVGKRVSLYYKVCAASFILLPALYLLSSLYLKRFRYSTEVLTILSLTGILMVLSDVMLYDSVKAIKTLTVLIFFTMVVYALKSLRLIQRSWPLIISLAFITTAGILFLFNSSRFITAQPETWFCLIIIAISLAYFTIVSRFGIPSRKFFFLLLPLAFSPLLLFFAFEGQFIFQDTSWRYSYKVVFLITLIFGFIGSAIYARRSSKSAEILAKRFFAPGAVLSFILLTIYLPFPEQSEDFFELGNIANAQMLMFEYGKLPMVDFFTSHMFSEQFYGIIYHLTHGYDGSADFLAYIFFHKALSYFLIFYFSSKLFKHWGVSLLLVLCMPYLNLLFGFYLIFSVLALLACISVLKSPSVRNHLLVFITLIGLVVWRLDTGVAALTASVLFLPLAYFTERIRPDWKRWFKAAGLTASGILILVLLAVALRSPEYIYDNFITALHYVAGNQAHGYSVVSSTYNHHFRIILFLLPIIALILLFLSLTRLRKSVSPKMNLTLYGAVFFFLVFLSNFPRGLVRHGFVEGRDYYYTSTFFLALALFAMSYFKGSRTAVRYSIFCLTLLLSLFSVRYFPLPEGKSPIEKFFTDSPLIDIDAMAGKIEEGRVIGHEVFAKERYEDLEAFLDATLSADQTFLDFSNSPMLYFYTGREVPAYFAQSLQNSIDDFTQLNHLERVDTNRVPVVIYSHSPPNWFDATDGVENAMRYYLVAEYIFKYYRPLKTINGLNVWVVKSQTSDFRLDENDPLSKPYYNYGHAPGIIFKYFEEESDELLLMEELEVVNRSVSLTNPIRQASNLFLSLTLKEEGRAGKILIKQFYGDRLVGTFELATSNGQMTYMLPLSNTLPWYELTPGMLKMETSEGLQVETVGFYKDLRREY